MRRALAAIVVIVFVLIPLTGAAQVYPPKQGVEIPAQLVDQMRNDRNAFKFQNAWIKKVERIKRNREAYIEERGFYYRPLLAPGELQELAVTGTIQVPVFCSKYANTGADPYPPAALDQKLFTGPNPPRTLTQFYSEISYGDITVTGAVYGWHQLSQIDTYYEGAAGCYSSCSSTGNIAQFITETLNAWDGSVNFGQYDNDGPDGVPNSGDDDGFVDFAAFVHPEVGAECNPANNNIWSHRWSLYWANYYQNGAGAYWTSNDAAAGGGNIRVNDYVVQPAWNCDGTTVIDIGVFCHEFGHAFGLPDLYDTDKGSAGIGHWGLMGSGSWNSVTQPAHMGAWAKSELGWVNLVEMGTNPSNYTVNNVEFNRPVLRANVMNERWRREAGTCAIGGVGTSMRCGLRTPEASARGWSGGEGYGNGWVERVSCEFDYDGSPGPIWLDYDYRYDSEATYDYTYAQIDVGGTVSNVATYHGTGTGSAHIDLSTYVVGSGQSSYTVYFEFQSDVGWSDEDGNNTTTCGPFVFDNVAVNGGGEAYFTDFETIEDGWWCDMTDPSECFFVENRQAVGSDANVHGGGGLCIWHIDHDVANSGMGNTGGSGSAPGVLPRGVSLEQSDGLMDLEWNNGRGDGGDAYPGSTTNMTFNGSTTPNSVSYDGTGTNVVVNLTTGNGDPIMINGTGSWFPPSAGVCNPPAEDNDKTVLLDIGGGGFVHGCQVNLVDGPTNLSTGTVDWVGKSLVLAEVDLNGALPGVYDVVVTNPGGGSAVLQDGFTINNAATGVENTQVVPSEFALRQNYPNPFNPTTTIPFDIKERAHATLTIYNIRGQVVRTLLDETLDARSYGLVWDGRNDSGQPVSSGVYFYKLIAGDYQDVRKLVLMK
jgi:M6 family metalloprotease-like protein